MANKYLKVIFITFLILNSSTLLAGGGPPPPPPPLPIDGGIIGLFLLATAFAIKKIRDNSRK